MDIAAAAARRLAYIISSLLDKVKRKKKKKKRIHPLACISERIYNIGMTATYETLYQSIIIVVFIVASLAVVQ